MSRPKEAVFDGHFVAPGQMLGRYELLLPLGAGGMGNVWVARLKGTRGFRKLVAIKTIRRTYEEAWMEQMFFQEATLASQIHHPNVVETLELGEQEGVMYLVMELVHGESLSYVIREAFARNGIPLPIAVNLIGQACKGLQAAHDLCDDEGRRIGLVHRDISPPNILVTYSGTVKIADFGVATTKSSGTSSIGEIKGKISYLAPEQARAQQDVDARADIFTTAVVLYLLTVRRHPFKAQTENETIARIIGEMPVTPPTHYLPDFPRRLESVLLRGLAKDRDARWPTATAFLDALDSAMPEAFGPHSEQMVADFVQEVLKERMAERRVRLRLAEDLAEKSGSHDSVTNVSAVLPPVAPPPPRPQRSRHLVAGAGLVLAGAILGIGSRFLAPRGSNARADTQPSDSMDVKTMPAAGVRGAEPSSISDDSKYLTFPPPLEASSASNDSGARRASRLSRSAGTANASQFAPAVERHLDADPASTLPGSLPSSGPSILRAHDALAVARAGDSALSAGSGNLAAAHPGAASPSTAGPGSSVSTSSGALAGASVSNNPATVAAAPVLTTGSREGPRMLPTRVAHALLHINPSQDPYRVKLPASLEQLKESFSAAVQVCVSPDGTVSSVRVLRSAGPAIDPQIPSTLGRWRYKPYLENGKAVPFCYSFRYEIGGEG